MAWSTSSSKPDDIEEVSEVSKEEESDDEESSGNQPRQSMFFCSMSNAMRPSEDEAWSFLSIFADVA